MSELLSMMRLAGPVILAEIGWMSMGLVDTIMVGPLGPAAIGAAGMSSSLFLAVAIFGMGIMLGLDALVAQSYGANRMDECVRWLQHGICLGLGVAPPIIRLSYMGLSTIDTWGLHPEVRELASPYLRVIVLSTLPLLLYATFRRYLQGIHLVRPVMYALVTANLVNAFVNWVLIYGRLGAPALGVEGAAWATVLSRVYMAAFLFVTILRERPRGRETRPHLPFRLEPDRIRRLATLGVPAAGQVTLEVGVFAAVSALAGRLDPVSLGAHQIALNIAAFAFMVPLRPVVGGRRSCRARGGRARSAPRGARRMDGAGRRGCHHGHHRRLAPPVLRTAAAGVHERRARDRGRRPAPRHRRRVPDVRRHAGRRHGVLRGIGDTSTPMTMNVIGHWVLGLPVGYVLCFWRGWGVMGLWVGLTIGLVFVALLLTVVWHRKAARFQFPEHAHAMPDLL